MMSGDSEKFVPDTHSDNDEKSVATGGTLELNTRGLQLSSTFDVTCARHVHYLKCDQARLTRPDTTLHFKIPSSESFGRSGPRVGKSPALLHEEPPALTTSQNGSIIIHVPAFIH
jgi:hypothetical protein